MFAVALLAALAPPQDFPDMPVSLCVRGQRLEMAVPYLAERFGLKLDVDGNLKDNVVAINVSKMPVKRLLNLIARANDASWEPARSGWVLVRPPELATRILQRDFDSESKTLNQRQAAYAQKVGDEVWSADMTTAFLEKLKFTLHPSDNRGVSLDGPRLASPVSRLNQWLFAHAPMNSALRLEPRGSVTFSSSPLEGAFNLDSASMAKLKEFERSQSEFASVVRASVTDAEFKDPIWTDVVTMTDSARSPLRFRLNIQDNFTSIGGSLAVQDRSGSTVSWAFVPYTEWLSRLPSLSIPEGLEATQNKSVPLSEAARSVERLLPREVATLPRYPVPYLNDHALSDADRQLLSRPDRVDPLSATATDLVFALGQLTQRDVVASLPDTLLTPAHRFVSDGNLSLRLFWDQQAAAAAIDPTVDDGVILVKPCLPTLSEKLRLDRRPLARLMTSLLANGYVPMSPWARYCAAVGSLTAYRAAEYLSMAPLTAIGYVKPRSEHTVEDMSAEFLGTLSGSLLDSVAKGQSIELATLDLRQRRLLSRLLALYGSSDEEGLGNQVRQVTLSSESADLTETELALQGMTDSLIGPSKSQKDTLILPSGAPARRTARNGRAYHFHVRMTGKAPIEWTVYEIGKRQPKESNAVRSASIAENSPSFPQGVP